MFWGLFAAAVFAWLAGMLGVIAIRAHRQQIPYDSPVGLRGSAVRRDEQTWNRAHLAATPFLGTAAAICLVQAAACAWAALSPDVQGGPYLAILVGTGIVLVSMLLVLAQKIGTRGLR